jgi:UDP-N-acetylglucosamine acyltransferase
MFGEQRIHPTAIIDPSAEIAPDVEIGPFCCIGPRVQIGAGTVLHSRVDIIQNAIIGSNCHIHSGTVLGGPPQDRKYRGEETYITLGDNNILREYVTIHRATGKDNVTRIGSDNMLMAYVHIGHNCDIGNHTTIASYVGISGHVLVEDYANFGGICGLHQGSRIGKLAMVGGMSGIAQDIPPFMLASGAPARVYGINVVGLRKAGVVKQVREELKEAFRLMYRSNLNMSQAIEAIEENLPTSPEMEHLLTFIRNTRNGFNGRGNTPRPDHLGKPRHAEPEMPREDDEL